MKHPQFGINQIYHSNPYITKITATISKIKKNDFLYFLVLLLGKNKIHFYIKYDIILDLTLTPPHHLNHPPPYQDVYNYLLG